MALFIRWGMLCTFIIGASVVIAAVAAGCSATTGVTALPTDDPGESAPVTPRLTGGSIPGGQSITGVVLAPRDAGNSVSARGSGGQRGAKGVKAAVVQLVAGDGSALTASTDSKGQFSFANVAGGDIKLCVILPGTEDGR